MIVCVCHRVSDRDIAQEVRHGCSSFDALQEELHCGTGCGCCLDAARAAFEIALAARPAAAEVHAITEAQRPRVIPIAAVATTGQAAVAQLAA